MSAGQAVTIVVPPQTSIAADDHSVQPSSSDHSVQLSSSDMELSTVAEASKALELKLTGYSQRTITKDGSSYLTPNIKTLVMSAFLFSLITIVQVFAAHVAHSQALLMDCISMGVDAVTYMGNIVVELRKRDGTDHKGTQLIACAISLSCLLYFTYDAMQESWGSVRVCQGWDTEGGDEDDVNGYITLGFALCGLAFDTACLWAFYVSNKKNGEARHVNMFTALLHVAADCLRSTSTAVMSILILWGGVNSSCADAYTSILIGVTIIIGGFVGILSWVKLLWAFMQEKLGHKASASTESATNACACQAT
jgi:divalent metal cation (Fe/Co/Zn/Cd) transporter